MPPALRGPQRRGTGRMGTPAPPPAGGGIGGAFARAVSHVASGKRPAAAPAAPLGGAFDELDDIDDILGGEQPQARASFPQKPSEASSLARSLR